MAIEGELAVTIRCNGRRVQDVCVRSTRPAGVQRLMRGRTPRDAVQIVTRLFSICGGAQGAAAASALAAARGEIAGPKLESARGAAVALETVQEHCLRLGVDWAQAMGTAPLVSFVRSVRDAIAPASAMLLGYAIHGGPAVDAADVLRGPSAAIRPLVERALLGMSVARWLAQAEPRDLQAWVATGVAPARWYASLQQHHGAVGASDVALMPAFDEDAIRVAVIPAWNAEAGFAAQPAWGGAVVETGALSRTASHPLLASLLVRDRNSVAVRLVARLTELALLLADTAGEANATAPVVTFADDAHGYAATQTARGVLLHRASIANGVIADYAILAPTEWNFRADGAFTRALSKLEGDDAAAIEREARLVAQAIDPCVACRIEVGYA